METSVPRQRDTADSALVDSLMRQAPVGLAFFEPDLRFRWVNAALVRLGHRADAGSDVGGDAGSPADPAAWAGLLPAQAWPEEIATKAEAALRKILAGGEAILEPGYAVTPITATPATPATSATSVTGAVAPPPAEAVVPGCA